MKINIMGIIFLMVDGTILLLLRRQWAAVSLIIGACYVTISQGIEIGPFHMTILRILIAIGLIRVIIRGERLNDGMNGLDKLNLVWGIWALASSFFHTDPSAALVYRLGLVFNAWGIYFLIRIFCRSLNDFLRICRITAIILIPVGIEMLFEMESGQNLFSILEGVSEVLVVRQGSFRAQGAFAHAILAGTVGSACLPLMFGLWQQHRKAAFAGVIACSMMIFAA